MHVPKFSAHQNMVSLSCCVKLKVLESYRHLSFWYWCFQAPLASYPAQKPLSLSRMHSSHCVACVSCGLPHVWTFTSVHRYPERVPRASCSSQCWDKARWQLLHFWYFIKGMVVVSADVVFNCELANVCSYFMRLWSSYESLPEASCETFTWANHLWLQWPSWWVTATAVLFAGSVSPVLLTKHRWIKYKWRRIVYFSLNSSNMWKVKRETIT